MWCVVCVVCVWCACMHAHLWGACVQVCGAVHQANKCRSGMHHRPYPPTFWTCWLTEHVYLLNMFTYWTCLLTEHVYLLNMFTYWTCLLTEHVYLLNMFTYWTCLLTEHVYLLNMFTYWTCLLTEHVYLLNMFTYWTCLLTEHEFRALCMEQIHTVCTPTKNKKYMNYYLDVNIKRIMVKT